MNTARRYMCLDFTNNATRHCFTCCAESRGQAQRDDPRFLADEEYSNTSVLGTWMPYAARGVPGRTIWM